MQATDAVVAISDCIMSIQATTAELNAQLAARIRRNWPALEELYSGTCAPYLTLDRLKMFLSSINIKDVSETNVRSSTVVVEVTKEVFCDRKIMQATG
ncbi:hypothetical protein [Pelagibacterium luteolum]|uniref:hypothetical protein n=1 Tax=Pelagibacterium luteolum TaxID=440168 RepID=UPI00115FB9D4|nr:hypothetical protein [Pelagibacterium luteolum]